MGYFSLLWAGLNPFAKAVGIEAAPRNVATFQKNIEANDLQDRVSVIPKAAGERSGVTTFNTGPNDQTGWGGISRTADANTITVPIVRLDDEFHDANIDVLKIDVEGADTWILLGCERLLKSQRIKTIYFEQNRPRMQQLGIRAGEAQDLLRDLGYECKPLGRASAEWRAFVQR